MTGLMKMSEYDSDACENDGICPHGIAAVCSDDCKGLRTERDTLRARIQELERLGEAMWERIGGDRWDKETQRMANNWRAAVPR